MRYSFSDKLLAFMMIGFIGIIGMFSYAAHLQAQEPQAVDSQWYDAGTSSGSPAAQPSVAQLQKVVTDLNNELIATNAELVSCQNGNVMPAINQEVDQTGPYTYDVVNGYWLDGFNSPVIFPFFIYGGVRFNRHFGRGFELSHGHAGHDGRMNLSGTGNHLHASGGHTGNGSSHGSSHTSNHK